MNVLLGRGSISLTALCLQPTTGLKIEDVEGQSIIDVLDVIRYRAESVGTIRSARDKLASVLPASKKSD